MFKKRYRLLVLIGLLGLVALFAACAAPAVTTPTEEGKIGTPLVLPTATPLGAEVKPIPGGTLRIVGSDMDTFGPILRPSGLVVGPLNFVHAQLLNHRFGPEYPIWNFDVTTGGLAESWEMSKDGLTYTFHLRKGVKWQNKPPLNGRELVANDVKWTVETHRATIGGPRQPQLEVVKSIECPDKYTVVMHLSEQRAEFLALMANPYVYILAPELLDVCGEDMNCLGTIVGAGPFQLKEYIPNTRNVWERNPTYYRANEGLPYLAEIRRIVVPDASTALAGFRAGQIDIRGISQLDLPSVKRTNPDIKCYEYAVGTGYALAMATDMPPFDNVLVRRAVSMAMDRKAVIDTLLYGYGLEAQGPMSPASEWYLKDRGECAKYGEYHPDEARRLLAEAGYPGGFATKLTFSSGAIAESAELWADYLGKIGIKVTLVPMEYAAFTAKVVNAHNYEGVVFHAVYAGGNVTPDAWLQTQYNAPPQGQLNYSRVNDSKVTNWIDLQQKEIDPVKRQQILNDLQMYLSCNPYYVYWPVTISTDCMQPWVHNYQTHAMVYSSGRIYERVWVDETSPGRK
jgi:peptide/nickel transport system substrate-binding protein